MNTAIKIQIDNSSYEQLLDKWRYAAIGDAMFHGELGEYFAKVMREKRDQLDHKDQVQASKNVGWS